MSKRGPARRRIGRPGRFRLRQCESAGPTHRSNHPGVGQTTPVPGHPQDVTGPRNHRSQRFGGRNQPGASSIQGCGRYANRPCRSCPAGWSAIPRKGKSAVQHGFHAAEPIGFMLPVFVIASPPGPTERRQDVAEPLMSSATSGRPIRAPPIAQETHCRSMFRPLTATPPRRLNPCVGIPDPLAAALSAQPRVCKAGRGQGISCS